MGFENSAGLGVSNYYGPRSQGGQKGFIHTDGSRNEFLVDLTAPGRSGDTIPTGNYAYVTEVDLTFASAIPAPASPSAVGSSTGGTLGAATYYYKVVALVGGGQGVASAEAATSALTGSTNSVTVTWSAVTGATGYQIYRGTATGAENLYYTVGAVTSFVDTGASGSVAGTPPTATSVTIGGVSVASATESSPVLLAEGNTGVVSVVGYSGQVLIFTKNISGTLTHNY